MQQTSPHTRRVHQVRLSAPSQDLIWRGQNLLEDALHTVSLPAADTSQLLFIRQFNVGTIHSQQSATSLSLSLEAKLQQLSAIALPGTDPAAAQAPAVIFPDDLAAYAHFAYRLAVGQSTGQSPGQSLNAWFWPCLLPHWQPTQSTHETVLRLLAHLATHAIAPLATATVLHQLQQQHALTPFLAVLQPQDGPNLLAQHGWSLPAVTPRPNSEVSSLHRPLPIVSQAQPQHWTADDPRTLWLTTLGLIAERPTTIAAPNLIAIAQQQIQSVLANSEPRHTTASPSSNVPHRPARPVEAPSVTAPSAVTPPLPLIAAITTPQQQKQPSPAPSTTSQNHCPQADSLSPTPVKRHLESSYSPHPPMPPCSDVETTPLPGFHTGFHTEYAGLIYLLNLLTYLHLPAYLLQYNNPIFPHLLLLYTAQRLGVTTEDPIVTVLANDDIALESFGPHQSALIAWYSALRGWLRRHTPFTLKALIHRPGTLALTPTHLDLTFDLTQVDSHIRRAGLDINPGWLPWFGRVVQFHYIDCRKASYQAFRERGDTP